ncbi:MAG: CDP-diacylglycerol--glycerol-3-phosphate 3-phosphatidyltransferase [Bacteroidetes bacterium]|nr:CDP-diacylglycerol--glycerol-3-phosphate 3-phosphatidyltransferase [Bacteroidota bacterium]
MKHIPNALTIGRILVTPILLALLFLDTFVTTAWACALFIIASISDWADGKMARRFGAGSTLGQFLDPVADKVLVLGTFFALVILRPDSIAWWLVALIATRDMSITALRIYLKRNGRTLKTSNAAKWKTTFQLTFLIALLLIMTGSKFGGQIGAWSKIALSSTYVFWALVIVTIVTVYTGILYFVNPEEDEEEVHVPS